MPAGRIASVAAPDEVLLTGRREFEPASAAAMVPLQVLEYLNSTRSPNGTVRNVAARVKCQGQTTARGTARHRQMVRLLVLI